MITRHFINLTNGIQAIEDYGLTDVRFVRIQSTACEQKRWEDILMQLSDDFMLSAALGHQCVVYDYGANKDVPRAIWQGLEWIKYALWRHWCDRGPYQPIGRAQPMERYFDEQYRQLGPRVKARLNYFKRYCPYGEEALRISSVTGPTSRDGDTAYYVGVLHRHAN